MSGTSSSPDVIVVGNGPVGATAALLLAQRGVRVTILDQGPPVSPDGRERVGSRAICQHGDVLDVWNEIGVGAALAEEGVRLAVARTFLGDQEILRLDLGERNAGRFPPFVNISQARTELLLAEQIERSPLIEQHFEIEATGVRQNETGVTIETSAADRSFSAPYAILATGPSSTALRESLGVSFPGQSYDDRFLICDIETDAFDGQAPERRFYFDPEWNPGRQVLIHPCPNRVYRIDWQVPSDFDLEAESQSGGLDRRIGKILGDGHDCQIVWKSVYRFHGRCASRFRVGRVLLAGDCAHLMAPFGARGLNSGVHDAENAAWKLAFVLQGLAGEELLESYDRERRAAALENLRVTEATMRFLVPQDQQDREKRRAILERAATDSEARSRVDSGKLYRPYSYFESPLTSPAPSPASTSPRPGDLLPDWLDGDGVPLRTLARRSLLFLTPGRREQRALQRAWRSLAVELHPLERNPVERNPVDWQPAIRIGPSEDIILVRPDAHVAAVIPQSQDSSELERAALQALRRLLCRDAHD